MRDFNKLEIWKRSHQLTLKIYKLSNTFPKSEQYGITSQIRRSASSVPTNIAEGCGRLTEKDFGRFLVIASGSLLEVEYLVILCTDLDYISQADSTNLNTEVNELKKMLYSYHRRLTGGK